MSEAVQREVTSARDEVIGARDSGAQREFFDSLESLRGLAAFLVVLYHVPPWFEPFYNITYIRHGYLMVDFFFVLSGFVLCHSYADRIRDRVSMSKFVVLRLGRLYPVHLVFMLPFLLIEVGKYVAFTRHGLADLHSEPALSKIARSLISNVLLVQGLGLTSNDPALNYPNWSISTEFYTYLVFGFGLLLFSKRGFKTFAAVLVAGCVALLLSLGSRLGDVASPLKCIAGFMVGCLTREVYQSFRGQRWKGDWPMLVMVVMLVALGLPWKDRPETAWFEPLFFPISAALIVTVLLTPRSLVNKVLMSRPIRWLGAISYSLYMCHAIVQWVARQVCRKLTHRPEIVDGMNNIHLGVGVACLTYAAIIAVTLGVAWVSYLLIENPSRHLAKRWVAHRWPSKGGALQAAVA